MYRVRSGLTALVALGWIIALVAQSSVRTLAQDNKPFALPLSDPPSPTTWLMSQQYGNTVGAYNFGRYWYAGGQNLHFGVDFAAACGTPVRAIGDGVIDQVDNFSFGLEPHNLTIFHQDVRLTSVYGHLREKPSFTRGQPIRRGDVIGVVGDPDLSCQSRPHLHLEIRSADYGLAYEPSQFIAADWDMLATIGYHEFGGFVKDLSAPNRWQTVGGQPDIDFNEAPLNGFARSWPPLARNAPPPYTRPAYDAPATGTQSTTTTVSRPGCCSLPWWSPDSKSVRYWNALEGQPTGIYEVSIAGGQPGMLDAIPLQLRSPDDRYAIYWQDGRVFIGPPAGNNLTPIATGAAFPQFSPGVTRLLWHRHPADDIPGGIPPQTEVWVSGVDGSGRQLVTLQPGGDVYWLDEDRLLLVEPVGRTNKRKLTIYTISKKASVVMMPEIGHLRGLAVAPGGAHVLLYAPFHPDPNVSGLYLLETVPNARAVKLPIFGSYRWRDRHSFVFIPFAPGQSMQLVVYDIRNDVQTPLTDTASQPIRVANDDWNVSPDGTALVWWEASDLTIRVLKFG